MKDPEPQTPSSGADGAARSRAAARAYEIIRDAILSQDLPFGTHLREETLCEMTGTSRTPVREALRRLVADGLAVEENRHKYVNDFSFSEVVIMFDLRAQIEGYTARIAAERIQPKELDALMLLIEEMDAIDPDADGATSAFLALNEDFHQTLVDACRSTQIKIMMRPIAAVPIASIKRVVMEQPINIRASNQQHREIHRALSAGNADWAEMAMRAHILSTRPSLPNTSD
ncbi:GntR family transcriptional regulator [Celeribacter litoreus]|uniref:GntR family transcriptional regulator n=1 Tax=Celeribacter litoreus TaxID=2876714 RepID=UPI001CCD6E44|nr:GntR family transcriptional regulator [Celeribacter litoreus]MCA0042528.1 GntR family transcriptional regulator [Celeribacter litoreus]